MNNDDHECKNLLTQIAAMEGIIKAQLCAEVDNRLDTGADKVAAVAMVSMAMAAAAIHSAAEAVTERGETATGEMVMGLFIHIIDPEMRALIAAMKKAGGE